MNYTRKDILLHVDYHDKSMTIRSLGCTTGEEQVRKYATTRKNIAAVVGKALQIVSPRKGRLRWVMESTTGWARVRDVLPDEVEMTLANVLAMPRPPKARRKKTDKIDTARLQRETLNGTLPEAFQPNLALRELRRLTAYRENLVSRRTALRNWIDRYLAHETWRPRTGLWSDRGLSQLRLFARRLASSDRLVLEGKLDELDYNAQQLEPVEQEMMAVYDRWPEAQRLDVIDGIGPISAVSILARIGPIERFRDAEHLIGYAGLAPGIHESAGHGYYLSIGGGGTDKQLRHYLIEASVWARRVPRYHAVYQRVRRRRGKKVARVVVCRMLLRSIYKMLKDDVPFDRLPTSAAS